MYLIDLASLAITLVIGALVIVAAGNYSLGMAIAVALAVAYTGVISPRIRRARERRKAALATAPDARLIRHN
jgi:hypothetical protein